MAGAAGVQGRRVFITGASSGLGLHFARTLAAEGARLAIAARRVDRLHGVAEELRGEGREVLVVPIDVCDPASVDEAIARACEALGGIDVLVNNAGIARPQPALEVDEASWAEVIDTNLTGAWRVAKAAALKMKDTGGGSIINIGSIAGLRVAGHLSSYCAAKAGLLHLNAALAFELARFNIRVNAIAPGYILTDMNRDFFESPAGAPMIRAIPQRRIGRPEELDGALLLLASEASSYMTGSVICVDGGHSVAAL